MCWGKMELKVYRNQPKTTSKFFKILGFLVCLLKNLEASQPGCDYALGMQSGRITNSQLSAYSKDFGYGPTKGRLNNNGAWCSKSKMPWTEYFQIVLDRVRQVSGIATQGYYSSFWGSRYWVRKYAVRYSFDGSKWFWYKDGPLAAKKEFDANTDGTTEEHVTFRETFVTKYLRIYPIKYKNDMCMRVEIYGCLDNKDSCTQTMSQSTGIITSPNYPLPYPKGMDCTWIITVPDTSKLVALFFKYFDVNDDASWGCFGGDYLEVLDGPTDLSHLISQYCNGDDFTVVKTTGRTLRIHFHSESGSTPRKGFEAQFVSFTKGVDDIYLSKACPSSTLRLDCSFTSKSIKILHVYYGSAPYSTVCGNTPTNTTCQASSALNTITSLCGNYKICEINVTSSQFGVSCRPGQVPRLSVYYQCTGTVIKTLPPSTSAPSTASSPTTTNTPSPITDTSSTTRGQGPSIPPTFPGSPPSTVASRTELSSTRPTSPGVSEGNKLARVEEDDNNGMVIGIVVAVILVVIVLVVILLYFLYKRRRNRKDGSMPGVTYTTTPITLDQTPPRTESNGYRSNVYESVNVLYVSADEPRGKEEDEEHIYDSPELQEPLPKMTNNPLYHGASGFDDDFAEYENVELPKEKPSQPPRSLAPSFYDSPKQDKNSLVRGKQSITNPNYDQTFIDIANVTK